MNETKVRTRVYKIVSQVFKTPVENITDDTSPDTLINWDSLQHMNLVLALEEAFQIQFDAEQIGELQSVKLILIVLKEKGCS